MAHAAPQTAEPLTLSGKVIRTLIILPQILARPSGTPLNTIMMCRALVDAGYEVHILAIGHDDPVEIEDCRIHAQPRLPFVGTIPIGFSPGKIVYNILFALKMLHLLIRHDFDVVHAIEESAFYAVPVARLFKKAAIMDLDSDLPGLLEQNPSRLARMLAPLAAAMRRRTLQKAHTVIAVNLHVAEISCVTSSAASVHLVPDVALREVMRRPDPAAVKSFRAGLGMESNRLVVYTGNLDHRQGVVELLRAMIRLKESHKDLKLLIVGGGESEIRALKEHVAFMGLDRHVNLLGQHPPDAMPEFMALADVLVSPRQEEFVTPLKIFSYMASQRPIVATDLPTHRDVLDDRSAFLVPADARGLADGIATVLNDPEEGQRRAANALALLNEAHSFEHFRDRLVAAYLDAIERHAGGLPQATGA